MGNKSFRPLQETPRKGNNRLPRSSTSQLTSSERHCVIRRPIHEDAVNCLTAVRPGIIVSGGRDGILALSNIDTGECLRKWKGHTREITKTAYRNLGGKNILLTGSRDTQIRLWDFKQPDTKTVYAGHEFSVTGLEIIGDNIFCSGSRDNTLKLWDIETAQCVVNRVQPRNMVTHLCRSKSDHMIAQTSEDKELKLWDSRDLSAVHQFAKKSHIQLCCDITPDGLYCITCSNGFNGNGCELTLWDLRQRCLLREMFGHDETVHCAIYLTQQVTWKKLILSVSTDHSARIWNMDDGSCLWNEYIPSGGDLLSAVGFNDGNIVVCGMNACLAHMRIMGRAGKPYLHTTSLQVQPVNSQSTYDF